MSLYIVSSFEKGSGEPSYGHTYTHYESGSARQIYEKLYSGAKISYGSPNGDYIACFAALSAGVARFIEIIKVCPKLVEDTPSAPNY
jgi:hypothetical protein